MNEEMKKAKDRYDEITIPEGIENMKRSDLCDPSLLIIVSSKQQELWRSQ